jgi:hypothetical protein
MGFLEAGTPLTWGASLEHVAYGACHTRALVELRAGWCCVTVDALRRWWTRACWPAMLRIAL